MTEKISGDARQAEPVTERPAKDQPVEDQPAAAGEKAASGGKSKEVGGRDGLDPTRFGDWEKNGRCIDF